MLRTFLFTALLVQTRSWECPAGFAGPEKCLGKENAGKCELQKPSKVDIDTNNALSCDNPNAKLAEFQTDLGGAGSYYKGCGLNKDGLVDSCCNCWPLKDQLAEAASNVASDNKGQCFPCHNSCCKWWWLCIFERCLFEGEDCSHQQC